MEREQVACGRNVFISYARSDGAALAKRLKQALLAAGHTAWLDTSEIAGGTQWGREIEQAIASCDCQLALLSQGSFHSEICRAEQLMCLDASKPVIPLLVQAKAPRPLHLFAKPYYDFADQAIFHERFNELASLLATPDLRAQYAPQPFQPSAPIHRFILLSEIADSARLSEEFPDAYLASLELHTSLIQQAVSHLDGSVYRSTGSTSIMLFKTARAGISCAQELARGFAQLRPPADSEPVLLRIALHGGELQSQGTEYFGKALNRAQRICQVCHAGQVLLSGVVASDAVGANGVELLDLGLHYLSDLAEAEHLYQLSDERFVRHEFPALPTLSNRPNNLQQQLTLFMGRERELAELEELLNQRRLVTIKAPGGYGKSRLAAQLCANLLPRFERGVFIVELAPIHDPALIVNQLASATGYQFYGKRDPEQQIIDFLREKEMLLCFDNFEHVLAGAPLVSKILVAAPRVKILITARKPLSINAEQVYDLDPLSLAGTEARDDAIAGGSDAAKLFADRAALRKPELMDSAASQPLIKLICDALQGVPLAIELAAAWTDVFALPELLAQLSEQLDLTSRLSDVPQRHRSVRASLDWSWNLLSEEQRRILMVLSAFDGGCFIDAAAAVLGFKGLPLRTALAALSDMSWLYSRAVEGQTRFYVRDAASHEYVFEKLEETRTSAEPPAPQQAGKAKRSKASARHQVTLYEQTMMAHARYFSDLMAREGPRLSGKDQIAAQRIIKTEIVNIIKALDTLSQQLLMPKDYSTTDSATLAATTSTTAADSLLPIARWLGDYTDRVSEYTLMLKYYDKLVKATKQVYELSQIQLWALVGFGRAARCLSDFDAAHNAFDEAKALAISLNDNLGIAFSLTHLAGIERTQGNQLEARELLVKALAIYGVENHSIGVASSLLALGTFESSLGRCAEALKLELQALKIYSDKDNLWGIASCFNSLGTLYDSQSDDAAAREYFTKSIAILQEINCREGLAVCLYNLGDTELKHANYSKASQHIEEALAIFRDIGNQGFIAHALHGCGVIECMQNNYKLAHEYLTEALNIRRTINDQIGIAASTNYLGNLDLINGNYNSARDRFAAALTIRRNAAYRSGEADSLRSLGHVAIMKSDFCQANEFYSKGLSISTDIGDLRTTAACKHGLGVLAYLQGRYSEACELIREALAIQRNIGDRHGSAASLDSLGRIKFMERDLREARTHCDEAMTIRCEIGDRVGAAHSMQSLSSIEFFEMRLGTACNLSSKAMTVQLETRCVAGLCCGLAQAGCLMSGASHQKNSALVIYGAQSHANHIGHTFDPIEEEFLRQGLAIIEHSDTGLPTAERERLRAQAKEMLLDDLAQFALDELEKLRCLLDETEQQGNS